MGPRRIGTTMIGLLLAALSGMLTTLYGYTGKLAMGGDSYNIFTVMMNIYLLQIPIAEVLVSGMNGTHILTMREIPWIFLRCTTKSLGSAFLIISFHYIPLGDASALQNLTIAFTMVIGWIFLKEECKLIEVIALVLTMGGGILVAQPEIIFNPGAAEAGELRNRLQGLFFGLASTVSFSLTVLIHYKRTRHHAPATITFYSVVIPTGGYLVAALAMGQPLVICHTENRIYVIIASVSGSLAILCAFAAYKYCTAGLTVLVLFAASMVFGFLFQLMLGVIPNYWSIAGASCIAIALTINMVNTAINGTKQIEKAHDNLTETPSDITSPVEAPPNVL